MTASRLKLAACAVGAVLSFGTLAALAQQPPQPAQPPMRRLPSGMPGGPGMPGSPAGMPNVPGHGPVTIGPDGKPRMGGLPGGVRPTRPTVGAPPTTRPHPSTNPHHVAEPEEEFQSHEECPGHGVDDPPPNVNYWHGLLMVDNVRSQQPGFLNQLLFRYENPKRPCDPKNEPPPYLASLLNFAVLAFVLFHYGKKPLADSLLARKKAITAEIDTATRLKDDAEARLADFEEKIENIALKLDEVRGEYAAQAELEKKHVIAEAEERRIRMRRDAEFRVEQERKAARDVLLAEAVLGATQAAEALIQRQMSGSDQDRMANAYLASVAKSLSDANGAEVLG